MNNDDERELTTTHAQVAEHRYSVSGKAYYIAWCKECSTVLNSGHHYRDRALAQATADRHNQQEHERQGCPHCGSGLRFPGTVAWCPHVGWTDQANTHCHC